ncbi:MAG: hypothetical protein U9Q99_00400 [Nanoarchaeota archaeon]|nr:hypothetical protein [Nanoarchaeota archaeon]
MEDFDNAYGVLVKYVELIDAQANAIRAIRKDKISLDRVLKNSLSIQKCANEIEANLNPRLNYLFCQVDDFLELDGLSNLQKSYLKGIKQKIWDLGEEFKDPKVKVKYY